jgi:hypothetical protein
MLLRGNLRQCRCDLRSHPASDVEERTHPSFVSKACSQALQPLPVMVGSDARNKPQGNVSHQRYPGKGKTGRVNASESSVRLAAVSRGAYCCRRRRRWPGNFPCITSLLAHCMESEVRVPRQGLPPLSGVIRNRRWVIPSAVTAQSSRSHVVPGGLNVYSWRRNSR